MLLLTVLVLSQDVGPHRSTPDQVVQALYAQIVKTRPIGIPKGVDRAALWPLLSKRLIRVLETAQRCEADYFRQHPDPDMKPEFNWLEDGLFSGPDEMALPSDVRVIRTKTAARERYRVLVRFTYRESFETHGRPPNPANTFQWHGEIIVEDHDGRFLVDDFRRIDEASGKSLQALSQRFAGCRGSRWIGYGQKR